MRTTFHYWLSLWERCKLSGDGRSEHDRLIACYSEAARGYHTVQHLEESLTALDVAKSNSDVPNADVIELALWFHDAVYDPKASDNEERSAERAREVLSLAAAEQWVINDVCRLILATKAHQANQLLDAEWLLDIDLSILGQPKERFDEYESQIRQEYAWVPDEVYRGKRAEVMAQFLDRDRIYMTSYFHDRLEKVARANLSALIRRLRHSPP